MWKLGHWAKMLWSPTCPVGSAICLISETKQFLFGVVTVVGEEKCE